MRGLTPLEYSILLDARRPCTGECHTSEPMTAEQLCAVEGLDARGLTCDRVCLVRADGSVHSDVTAAGREAMRVHEAVAAMEAAS
jgi:hypothetical protein